MLQLFLHFLCNYLKMLKILCKLVVIKLNKVVKEMEVIQAKQLRMILCGNSSVAVIVEETHIEEIGYLLLLDQPIQFKLKTLKKILTLQALFLMLQIGQTSKKLWREKQQHNMQLKEWLVLTKRMDV